MIANFFLSLSIFTCITVCNYGQSINYRNQTIKSPIILQVNNKDYKKIGFELITADESNGVKSIILEDTAIYLLDAFHNNIKKINLVTGKLRYSLPLSDTKAWLRDLVVFDKKLFVITDLEKNYILDMDLNLIKSFRLPPQTKYVYKIFKDSLLIYNFGKVITINSQGIYIEYKK